MTPDEVRAFTPLVKACAGKFDESRLPGSMGADDVESICWQALILAERRFDPSRSPSFSGWAWVQMRRAVLSEIQRQRFGKRSAQRTGEPVELDEFVVREMSHVFEIVEARMALREWVDAHRRFCECGCGGRTNLAPQTMTARGWVKGEPLRFVHGHNRRRVVSLPDGGLPSQVAA